MSSTLLAGIGAGALAGALAWPATRWLASRRYRYDDEADFPRRPVGWVRWVIPVVAALIVLAWWDAAPGFALVAAAYSAVLVVASAIDADVQRLPDKITLPLIPLTALGVLAVTLPTDAEAALRAVLAGGALGLFYFLQVLIAWGKGMGLGDVKLALSLGMVLGAASWSHVLMATVITYVGALLWGLALVVFRGANRKTSIAFGPAMAFGAIVVLALPAVGVIAGLASGV